MTQPKRLSRPRSGFAALVAAGAIAFAAVAPAALAPGDAAAQTRVEGIAAVVNDDVVSMSDVDNRLDLALLCLGPGRATAEIARAPDAPGAAGGLDRRAGCSARKRRGWASRCRRPKSTESVAIHRAAERLSRRASSSRCCAAAASHPRPCATRIREQAQAGAGWCAAHRSERCRSPTPAVDRAARTDRNPSRPAEYACRRSSVGRRTRTRKRRSASFANELVRQSAPVEDFRGRWPGRFSQGRTGRPNGGDPRWVLQGQPGGRGSNNALQRMGPGPKVLRSEPHAVRPSTFLRLTDQKRPSK